VNNLAEKFPDREPPTKPCEQFPTRVLVLAHKIDRLAETALDALRTGHDDAVSVACHALVELQHLAAEVAR
jgi:hypothetical protein